MSSSAPPTTTRRAPDASRTPAAPCPAAAAAPAPRRGMRRGGGGSALRLLAALLATPCQAYLVPRKTHSASVHAGLQPASPSWSGAEEAAWWLQGQALSQGQQSNRGSGGGDAVREEMPICISGQAVPRLYVLGVTKCGTSTMVTDLWSIHAEALEPFHKEGEFFDETCGFQRKATSPNYTGCPAPTEELLEALPGELPSRSCSPNATLMDGTPANYRMPGLPRLLSAFYADQARRVGFIILYREPLARLHSNWWMRRRDPKLGEHENYTFADYLAEQDHLVQLHKAHGYDGMELDARVDFTYRSFYSLPLPGWLQMFTSDQFIIIPMMLYVNSTRDRDATLELIASKFGGTLQPAALRGKEVRRIFPGSHPELEDEVDAATVEHWYAEYFKPDLRRLASLLALHVPSGLTVAGYSGAGGAGAAAAEGMLDYLCGILPCLA